MKIQRLKVNELSTVFVLRLYPASLFLSFFYLSLSLSLILIYVSLSFFTSLQYYIIIHRFLVAA